MNEDEVVRAWVRTSAKESMLAEAAAELRETRAESAEALARVRVLVVCADVEGIPRSRIAELLGVNRSTVYRVLGEDAR